MAKSSDGVLYDSKWYVQSKDRLKIIALLSDCFLLIIDKRRTHSMTYMCFPLFFRF